MIDEEFKQTLRSPLFRIMLQKAEAQNSSPSLLEEMDDSNESIAGRCPLCKSVDILIVDDVIMNLEILKVVIYTQFQLHCATAENGQ